MDLFTPFTVKGLTVRNRVVMAPMATNMAAAGGFVTAAQIEYYRERARGGTGMVMVEAVLAANYPGTASGRLGLWSDEQIGPLGELAAAIAEAGSVPVVQIIDHSLRASGRRPINLAPAEIQAIIANLARATERARAAGFAAVDLHACHSATLSDFLSRRANTRTDAYGGSEVGRARIVTETLAAMRAAVGPDYPLFCRFNADEYTVKGNTLKHTIPLSRMLLQAGADVLDVSAGGRHEDGGAQSYSQLRGRPAAWLPDGANVYLAAAIKEATGAPVIAVGKLGDPAAAERALASGSCDLVALGRPLLADPWWVQKVQAGRRAAIKRCRCCDRCMELFREEKPVHCVTFAEA